MGLGDVVFKTLFDWVKSVFENMTKWAKKPIIDEMTLQVAKKSLNEDMFKTKEVKDIVTNIKKQWSGSPEEPG
ncbi:unnamed protein product, partial [marine sediment metagenome]